MATDISTLPGVQVKFLGELLVTLDNSTARVFRPGDTLVLTQLILDSSIDRVGNSFWRHLDSPDEQIARWGAPVFERA